MNAIEVCCGAGGMSLGLKKAGIKIGLAIDFEPKVLKIYEQNLKTHSVLVPRRKAIVNGDLANLLSLVPEAMDRSYDLICGSPPCQDFSSAGKRKEGPRADIDAFLGSVSRCITTSKPACPAPGVHSRPVSI